jgi:hypothetical protein
MRPTAVLRVAIAMSCFACFASELTSRVSGYVPSDKRLHRTLQSDPCALCATSQFCGTNGTCFDFNCGIYLSHTACNCTFCSSSGGFCGAPSSLPGATFCYDLQYPQCVIDSVGLAGGTVGPLFMQNSSTCSGVETGTISVVLIDYGSSTAGAALYAERFVADLGSSQWWSSAASYPLAPE